MTSPPTATLSCPQPLNLHLGQTQERVEDKMASNTPAGRYQHLVIPLGLADVPAVLGALVSDVLKDVLKWLVVSG